MIKLPSHCHEDSWEVTFFSQFHTTNSSLSLRELRRVSWVAILYTYIYIYNIYYIHYILYILYTIYTIYSMVQYRRTVIQW